MIAEDDSPALVCNACEHEWCGKCNVAWHSNKSCDEYQRLCGEKEADQGLEEYRKSNRMNQVPHLTATALRRLPDATEFSECPGVISSMQEHGPTPEGWMVWILPCHGAVCMPLRQPLHDGWKAEMRMRLFIYLG